MIAGILLPIFVSQIPVRIPSLGNALSICFSSERRVMVWGDNGTVEFDLSTGLIGPLAP